MNTYLTSQWGAFRKDVWLEMFPDEDSRQEILDEDFFIEVAREVYEYEKDILKKEIEKCEIEIDQLTKINDGKTHLGALASKYQQVTELRGNERNFLDPEILSDPVLAYEFLENFHEKMVEENVLLLIVSHWYSIISDLDTTLADRYLHLVQTFFVKRNLRYQIRIVSNQFVFEYNPAVLAMECILRTGDRYRASDRGDIFDSFEKDLRELYSDQSEQKIQSIMRTSSNLIEHSLNVCANTTGKTTRRLIERGSMPADFFPHDKIKDMILDFNDFFNSYPNLRHAGNLETKKRRLVEKDAVMLGSFAALFSDYLTRK